ncbi:hypothetical protein LTS07_009519 [Exophiala sideris]|uniref:Transcription factor domain-containing protein n=1 Tax=Exophiala sideris TaxID=1016849 RepID=A0ABR0IZ64_9EURO|nr:hypothetical protein LTS07_009519 [Exophiala sideris]KAK5026751.1 hypothetical protein LTR13_009791 [Exophiala sideris]KAK5052404.1 hypothetical protein LTR69_009742 [Exophiala sideris]KAK5178189.1 hypothetical protein LTR44_009273 [Eurotiomycetes sp. CCFEE 6388]
MAKHWTAATLCKWVPRQEKWDPISDYRCWSALMMTSDLPQAVMPVGLEILCDEPILGAFLDLSACFGCVLYTTNKILAPTFTKQARNALLAEIVCQFHWLPGIQTGDVDMWSFHLMTAIKQLLDQGADSNSLLTNNEKNKRPRLVLGPVRSDMMTLMGKVTIWELYVLETLQICHFHKWDEDHKYTPDRAIQLFRLSTAFLCNGAHLSIFNIPDDDRRSVVKSTPNHDLPRSFGAVLERLRLATLDPKHRLFVTSMKEGDVQRMEAAYQETLKAYRRRTLGGRILLGFVSVRSKLEELSRSPGFQSLCIFISGGLVFLVISRWLA